MEFERSILEKSAIRPAPGIPVYTLRKSDHSGMAMRFLSISLSSCMVGSYKGAPVRDFFLYEIAPSLRPPTP